MALIFNELTKSLGAKEYFSWPPVLECPWVSAHLASKLLGCWVAGLLAIWQPGSLASSFLCPTWPADECVCHLGLPFVISLSSCRFGLLCVGGCTLPCRLSLFYLSVPLAFSPFQIIKGIPICALSLSLSRWGHRQQIVLAFGKNKRTAVLNLFQLSFFTHLLGVRISLWAF